jgi:hypothetical protein
MLKHLKRWLGWDTDAGLFDLADFGKRSSSGAATPKTRPPAPPAASTNVAPPATRAKTERSPMDVLDNPRLTLDKPADDGFDPYNTGAFNRSTSWERIGRQRKR